MKTKNTKLNASSLYGDEAKKIEAQTFKLDNFPMFKAAIENYKSTCRMGDTDFQIGVIDMRYDGASDSAKVRQSTSGIGAKFVWDDEVDAIYQEWCTRHPNYVEEAASEHMKELEAGPRGEDDLRFISSENSVPSKGFAEDFIKEFVPEKMLRTAIRNTVQRAMTNRKRYHGVSIKNQTQALICNPISNCLFSSELLSTDRFCIIIVVLFDDFNSCDTNAIDTKLTVSFKLNTETVKGFPYDERPHQERFEMIYKLLCPKPYRCDNVFDAAFDPEFEQILFDWCAALEEVPEAISDVCAEAGFLFIDFENITLPIVAKMHQGDYIDRMFTDDDIEDFDKTKIIFSDTSQLRHKMTYRVKPKYILALTDGLNFVVNQAGKDAVYIKLATDIEGHRSDLYLFNCRASTDKLIAAAKEIDAERKARFDITDEDITMSRNVIEGYYD